MTTTTTSRPIINPITAAIDDLVARRQKWEANELRTSNQVLYGILADCYKLYFALKGDRTAQKALTKALADAGIPNRSNTPLATKVIKSVFGEQRRRAYTYSVVLRAAIKQNISVAQLADWIEQKGGVEEIRLTAKTGISTAEQFRADIEAGDELVENSPSVTVLPQMAETPTEACVVLLVGVVTGDGKTEIKRFVYNESLVNQVLALIGKDSRQQADASAAASNSDDAQAAVSDAIGSVAQNDDQRKAA
ncbi:MAG: hypothetical protein NXI18_08885 [Alphaproteobacteria bacterium]|nr:hypothetical protein [Alphaproteobacteria bacterium]